MKKNNSFKVAALAASIALTMTATSAMAAAPTATQLPGQGLVTGTVTPTIDATHGTMDLNVSGAVVINWGKGTGAEGNTNLNSTGVAGFNIGADAKVTFAGTGGVLNIDSSGNASQILGDLTSDVVKVFVANENGIIVGDQASITSNNDIGLIADKLGATTNFDGTLPKITYDGNGGDVTVQAGATIAANGQYSNLLIAGGGNVNVDMGKVTSGHYIWLTAGLPSDDTDFGTGNDAAVLTVTGKGTVTRFASAGDGFSSGDLTIGIGGTGGSGDDVAGTFTNTGTLKLSSDYANTGVLVNEKTVTANGTLTLGGLTNNGVLTADGGLTVNGDMTNVGQYSGGGITVTKGDLTNDGTITGNAASLTVTNGSIVNNGDLTHFSKVETLSDDHFTAGADYSVTNAGTIGASEIDVNGERAADNDTTGSFTNTGVLQIASDLTISANDDLNLGGSVQVWDGNAEKYVGVSADHPLSTFHLIAGNGTLTVATPLVFGSLTPNDNEYANLSGQQIKLMADVTGVSSGDGSSFLYVTAGDKLDDDYAIRVANGVTVAVGHMSLMGRSEDEHPNVILQGTLSGNDVEFGAYEFTVANAVSDVFTGPNGGILATGDDPNVLFNFTGRVKTAPYLNDANFRYNGLPITVVDDDSVYLFLNPIAYQTNGTSNGLSAVNLLVNGNVDLQGLSTPDAVEQILNSDNGSAVTGLDSWENTHLVLQSTGSIETVGNFYWPGYVYLGNIGANTDGSAAPGTLGLGQITLGGDFTNVLPGSLDNGGGIHFMTQFPLQAVAQESFCLGGNGCGDDSIQVTTNGGSWVNFATDTLTQGYASGALGGDVSFVGGTQGPGNVVNYGKLDAAMFHTQAPDAAR